MSNDLSPEEDESWCAQQRENVLTYLAKEDFASLSIGNNPAWHVAPIVSVWAVESVKRPGWVGWWVVSGDFPTDYTPCGENRHPRQALRDIGLRWQNAVERWSAGERIEGWRLSSSEQEQELAPLLAKRAALFLNIAGDDGFWVD